LPLPRTDQAGLRTAFPELTEIGAAIPGGQKLVFPCRRADDRFVLKVMRCDIQEGARLQGAAALDETEGGEVFDVAAARAQREVNVLRACNSPHVAKLGPIDLCFRSIAGERVAIFSEEFIDGASAEVLLRTGGPLAIASVSTLMGHLALAVDEIWKQGRIHRDIKPGNVMRRSADGSYVLLDPGIAFDVNDQSLTSDGLIPHTPGWIAPELCNPFQKRQADCRADLFLVGMLAYLASTGRHPFQQRPNMSGSDFAMAILRAQPPAPNTIRPDLPASLNAAILRLLEKQKHRRFRNGRKLIDALSEAAA